MKSFKPMAAISGVIWLLTSGSVQGQDQRRYSDVWFFMLTHLELSHKWQAGNEWHWRCTNGVKNKEQLLIRPFLTYRASSSIAYSAGYTYIRSYPYQDMTHNRAKPEHNVWEQVTLKHSMGQWNIYHRYRLEHRFQGLLTAHGNEVRLDGYDFSNRFRYRVTFKRAVSQKIFLHLFDEVWLATDGRFSHDRYDRNWLYLGAGYKLSALANIQLAYLHQNIRKQDGHYEIHPTVQFTLQCDFKRGSKS